MRSTHPVVQIDRIVRIHRGMIRREIQRGEIVPLCLCLRPRSHCKAQLPKDRDDLLDYERHRMLRPCELRPGRHCEIDAWGIRSTSRIEDCKTRLEPSFDRLDNFIVRAAGRRTFFGGEFPQPFRQRCLPPHIAAEVPDAHSLERFR